MRALALLFLFSSFGCATILRGSNRDLTIYGPEGLQVSNAGAPVPLDRQGVNEAGQIKYVGQIERHTEKVTIKAPSRTVEATLDTHVSAGWPVCDFILTGVIGILVDYATGAWKSYDEITFGSAKPAAPAVSSQQSSPPPPQQTRPPPASQGPPPPSSSGRAILEKGKLAVLDFQNYAKDLSREQAQYFADVVRGAALRSAPGLEVMTRENLLVLLQATGKDLAGCEGECEVDTGRRIGADAVISGEILKVGSRYKISLKLHETHDGRLLSTGVASGKNFDELDDKLQQAVSDLLAPR
jgi:TolB-like protein